MTLAACGGGPTEVTAVITPDGTATITFGPTTVVTTVAAATEAANIDVTEIPCLTPLENVPVPTQTSTPSIAPWKTDTGYEEATGSRGYDPVSNSIKQWGTNNTEPARKRKAEKVYEWICKSKGCPDEKTLATWILFKEGGNTLYYEDQERMGRGIHYRFARWGFNADQWKAYTAFLNPKRDDVFDETDWQFLTAPGDLSSYQEIINMVYQDPYTGPDDPDGRYYLWFNKDEMNWAKVEEADFKSLGPYTWTTRVDGLPFYFTGIPNVHRCATMAICDPPKE